MRHWLVWASFGCSLLGTAEVVERFGMSCLELDRFFVATFAAEGIFFTWPPTPDHSIAAPIVEGTCS